jgi:hypothetical protein
MNCYISQALFYWFLKCTVVMFFIKIIISLKVFQTYIKVGIQIFESLLENVMTKKALVATSSIIHSVIKHILITVASVCCTKR